VLPQSRENKAVEVHAANLAGLVRFVCRAPIHFREEVVRGKLPQAPLTHLANILTKLETPPKEGTALPKAGLVGKNPQQVRKRASLADFLVSAGGDRQGRILGHAA
jgi:hypothetical protein